MTTDWYWTTVLSIRKILANSNFKHPNFGTRDLFAESKTNLFYGTPGTVFHILVPNFSLIGPVVTPERGLFCRFADWSEAAMMNRYNFIC
jgi:hypothetical protein